MESIQMFVVDYCLKEALKSHNLNEDEQKEYYDYLSECYPIKIIGPDSDQVDKKRFTNEIKQVCEQID